MKCEICNEEIDKKALKWIERGHKNICTNCYDSKNEAHVPDDEGGESAEL